MISKKTTILKQYDPKIESHSHKLKSIVDTLFKEPIIFVGGYPSSGTTLMRSILDVHPDVKCGPELAITFKTIDATKNLTNNKLVKKFIRDAGIKNDDIDKALGLFQLFLYLINVPNANRICNKEPGGALYIDYYKRVFPNSKYIYMIRDGREVAFSMIKRWSKDKITFENYYKILKGWNWSTNRSYNLCLEAGKNYCKEVRYENLVNKPKETIKEITKFLNLEWTDKFLNHQKYLEKDIKLSKHEPSLYGIMKEINNQSLNNWVGKIKSYNSSKINQSIKMLKKFQYII